MLYLKILVPILAYLLGNLNFGILVSKLVYKEDIREQGSGNAGSTNAFRVYGKAAGVFVLVADALKGVAAVLLAQWLLGGENNGLWPALAGLCVMLGHIYPALFKFKGGKGVATTAGVMAAQQPFAFLTLLVFPFASLLFTLKYMSVASISAAVLLPVAIFAWSGWQLTPLFWVSIAQAAVIIFAHRENIKRLLAGNENKLFQKKK